MQQDAKAMHGNNAEINFVICYIVLIRIECCLKIASPFLSEMVSTTRKHTPWLENNKGID